MLKPRLPIATEKGRAAPVQRRHTLSILLVLFILTGCSGAGLSRPTETSAPKLVGAYLGQPLPGSSPQRFAAGIVKGDLHTSPVFTPDGDEVYWSLQGGAILVARLAEDGWTQPESVSLAASMRDYRDPAISPSGDKLFFLSKGRLPDSEQPEKENIWFVERAGEAWGEPRPLGEEVNALTLHWQISVAANGDLYFSSSEPDGVGDIYISRRVEGEYVEATMLAAPVNTEKVELTPYIAPDQSYLIFARMEDQSGTPRLYISYAGDDRAWGEPVLVERVDYGLCPVVSPDGLYLFFLSSPQGVSWMSTEFIEDPRPGE